MSNAIVNAINRCRIAGIAFLAIGAAIFLLAGFSFLRTMNQAADAEKNRVLVQERWQSLALDTMKSQQLAVALSTNAVQLAEKNSRIKMVLTAAGLLLVFAGAMLWYMPAATQLTTQGPLRER